jgi:hypothetical protein
MISHLDFCNILLTHLPSTFALLHLTCSQYSNQCDLLKCTPSLVICLH